MSDENYFEYLKTRSKLAHLYRRNVVYPGINGFLNGKVLDIGCGIGDFLSFRKNTIGADVNPFIVDYCNGLGYEAHLIKNGVFPFQNNTFEGAVLDNVLEHLVDPQSTLTEISRILKHKGRLVIGVPGILGYQKDDDHKVFYEENEMIELLAKCGFVKVDFIYRPFYFRSQFLSRKVSQYCIYGVFELQ